MLKQPALGGRRPLVQFRAGKMTYRDGMVYPEPTLGLVTVVQGSGMVDLMWTGSGKPDEMAVIARGSAQFNRVDKCTTGRVFVLQLNGSSTNPSECRFYWMQDPNEEKDADILRKVRQSIGQREDGIARAAGRPAGTEQAGPISTSAFQSILASLGQNPTGAAATTTSAASPASPISPANATTGSSNAASLAASLQSMQQSNQRLDLQALLGSNEMRAALQEDPAYYLSRLEPHLPAPPPTDSEDAVPQRDLLDEVRNPQASASAAVLQSALSDSPAAFREVCTAFGLNTAPAGATAGYEMGAGAFIRRVQTSNPPQEQPTSANAESEDTKDEAGKAEKEE